MKDTLFLGYIIAYGVQAWTDECRYHVRASWESETQRDGLGFEFHSIGIL